MECQEKFNLNRRALIFRSIGCNDQKHARFSLKTPDFTPFYAKIPRRKMDNQPNREQEKAAQGKVNS